MYQFSTGRVWSRRSVGTKVSEKLELPPSPKSESHFHTSVSISTKENSSSLANCSFCCEMECFCRWVVHTRIKQVPLFENSLDSQMALFFSFGCFSVSHQCKVNYVWALERSVWRKPLAFSLHNRLAVKIIFYLSLFLSSSLTIHLPSSLCVSPSGGAQVSHWRTGWHLLFAEALFAFGLWATETGRMSQSGLKTAQPTSPLCPPLWCPCSPLYSSFPPAMS